MNSPWMQSKYTDKAVVCAICGQWISQGEPRKFNPQSKVSAHDACAGARQMGDHVGGDPSRPVPIPPPKESPERESREAAIERMHAENVAAMRELTNTMFNFAAVVDVELRSLKGAVVEQTMMLVEALKGVSR